MKKIILPLVLFFHISSYACQCTMLNTTLCGNIQTGDIVLLVKKMNVINNYVVQCEVLDVIAGEFNRDIVHLTSGDSTLSCSFPMDFDADSAIVKVNLSLVWTGFSYSLNLSFCDNYISYIDNGRVSNVESLYDTPPTYIEWLNAFQDCVDLPPTRILRGNVRTTSGNSVEGVQVQGVQNYGYESLTDINYGRFILVHFVEGDTLVAYKNSGLDEGVTSLDVVALEKHLLGTAPFYSPYQYIAADVNNSGTITTIDLIQLQRIILHQFEELPNNTSWRFVDEDYTFSVPTNPWFEFFSEQVALAPEQFFFNTDNPPAFIGIKVGDVNLSL